MKKAILLLSFSGLLFASYMSFEKFFNDQCALGEGCPYFLGFPACYYGLGLYLVLTVLSFLYLSSKVEDQLVNRLLLVVSFLGILFAGYFTLGELPLLFSEGVSAYVLGLPTCAIGFLFYVAIFVLTLRSKRRVKL